MKLSSSGIVRGKANQSDTERESGLRELVRQRGKDRIKERDLEMWRERARTESSLVYELAVRSRAA